MLLLRAVNVDAAAVVAAAADAGVFVAAGLAIVAGCCCCCCCCCCCPKRDAPGSHKELPGTPRLHSGGLQASVFGDAARKDIKTLILGAHKALNNAFREPRTVQNDSQLTPGPPTGGLQTSVFWRCCAQRHKDTYPEGPKGLQMISGTDLYLQISSPTGVEKSGAVGELTFCVR